MEKFGGIILKKKSVILMFIIAVVLTFGMLSGCTKTQEKQKNQGTVKVRLNEVARSIFYVPMYAAMNEGFFKAEGLDIELSTGQGADKTMQQVLSNNADIGFCGSEQVIYTYNQGREDYAIIFAQLTKRDGSFLVSRKSEPNFKWEDVKGKNILGGRPGGVPEMTLEYVLKTHGITFSYNGEKPAKDVNIITNVAYASMAEAFAGGVGDYVELFEPSGTMLEKAGKGYTVASIGTDSGELPYTCFFTTKSYMEKNPQIVQKFTNALYKGILWADSHSNAEIAQSIKSFFPGTDVNDIEKVVKRYRDQDSWQKDLIMTEDVLNRFEDIISSYKSSLLPKKVPYNKIFTDKFAKEAAKNSSTK